MIVEDILLNLESSGWKDTRDIRGDSKKTHTKMCLFKKEVILKIILIISTFEPRSSR